MATNTYVALDKVTVATPTSTINFTNINQTYTDLVLIVSGSVASGANVYIRVGNGSLDTGSNYSMTSMVTGSSAALSERQTSQNQYQVSAGTFFATDEQCNIVANFQGYSNSTTNKTFLTRANSVQIGFNQAVGLWRSTSAINTISVYASQNFKAGTTFSLYGIAAVGGDTTPKATGGVVTEDATYYYHTFLGSSTFTPLQSLSCDVLVVAGGGGGGAGTGSGGGGAGGMQEFMTQALSATPYSVLVGSGGAISVAGNNSQFGSLTASVGGGQGGTQSSGPGGNGGSGGGGQYGGSTSGGSGTSGQGNAGGQGIDRGANSTGGGGGGGKSAAGQANPNTTYGGAGGAGATSVISGGATTGAGQLSGGSYYFAGGGGGAVVRIDGFRIGGDGGLGGGGNSGRASNTISYAGTANTGGGGGGSQENSTNQGSGGSGIVIVRYAKA